MNEEIRCWYSIPYYPSDLPTSCGKPIVEVSLYGKKYIFCKKHLQTNIPGMIEKHDNASIRFFDKYEEVLYILDNGIPDEIKIIRRDEEMSR